jgi:monothiol glutaredoxin
MHRSENNPFKITATPDSESGVGRPITPETTTTDPVERIRSMIDGSAIFLLIKGTPQRPQCGFSANTVAIMESLGVPYRTFDVLADESIRDAAKRFAGWPTFPQVYVNGEFIGGNDILVEMFESGEIQNLIAGVDA